MSHTRPAGSGWVTGQQGEPVQIQADPPGDGIGPDLTPPDRIEGQDPGEYKRLAKDHKQALKDAGRTYTEDGMPGLNESAEEPATAYPFPDARVSEPQDPREGKGAR